jgi:hypothetical protein
MPSYIPSLNKEDDAVDDAKDGEPITPIKSQSLHVLTLGSPSVSDD